MSSKCSGIYKVFPPLLMSKSVFIGMYSGEEHLKSSMSSKCSGIYKVFSPLLVSKST